MILRLLLTLFAATVTVTPWVAPAPAPARTMMPPATPQKERTPFNGPQAPDAYNTSNRFDHAYPRWLSYTNTHLIPDAGTGLKSPVNVDLNFHNTSVSTDSRNNAHIASCYIGSGIYYQNNVFETRRTNGFSEPAPLELYTDHPGESIELISPDIWVDRQNNDATHAVWILEYPTEFRNYLHYRRKSPSANWSTAISIGGGVDSQPFYPQVMTDHAGRAHVVAIIRAGASTPAVKDDNFITFVHWMESPAGSQTFTSSTIATGMWDPPPAYMGPVYADPGGGNERYLRFWVHNNGLGSGTGVDVWAVWGGGPGLRYSKSLNGAAWQAAVPFGDSGGNYPDVCVDSLHKPHAVWTVGADVRHQYDFTGSVTTVNSGDTGAPSEYKSVIVQVDSRNQPHVFWPGLRYAARTKNQSDPAALDPTWRQQMAKTMSPPHEVTSPRVMGQLGEVAMTANDQFHVVDALSRYTRTMEYNTGVRDPMAMIPAFPGASINAANGNLHARLPIYSTNGQAPNQAFELVYNSLDPYTGYFAPGWKSVYEIYLIDHWHALPAKYYDADTTITLFLADGRAVHFIWDTTLGVYRAEKEFGHYSILERMNVGPPPSVAFFGDPQTFEPTYRLTTKYGEKLWFESGKGGRLTKIQALTGNDITLGYTNGQLTTITDQPLGGNPRVATILYSTDTDFVRGKRATKLTFNGRDYVFKYEDPTHVDPTYTHLSSVTFPEITTATGPLNDTGFPVFNFSYYNEDNFGAKERMNLLKQWALPRGAPTIGNYGYVCRYFQDNRCVEVEDPQENLIASEAWDATQTNVKAKMSLSWVDPTDDSTPRECWLTNRRGKETMFIVEPRRSLVREIYDSAALAGTNGIESVLREFDEQYTSTAPRTYGVLTDVWDRVGCYTKYIYWAPNSVAADQLRSISRSNGDGSGYPLMADFYYNSDTDGDPDGPGRVWWSATYAEGQARSTFFEYEHGQVKSIDFPDFTRPDGATYSSSHDYTYSPSAPYYLTRITESSVTNLIPSVGLVTDFYEQSDNPLFLPEKIVRSLGLNGETFQYDFMGNVTQHTLPQGAVGNLIPGPTINTYDPLYRITRVQDPVAVPTDYGYDLDSNRIKVNLPTTGMELTKTNFDKRGFVTGGEHPDGSAGAGVPDWSQWVDANGNIRRVQNLRGFVSNTTYDSLDRVSQTRVPGGSTGPSGGGGGYAGGDHITDFVHDCYADSTSTYFSTATRQGSPSPRRTWTIFDTRGLVKQVIEPDAVGGSATALPSTIKTNRKNYYDNQNQLVATELLFDASVKSCTVYERDELDRVDHVRVQDAGYINGSVTKRADTYTLHTPAGGVEMTTSPLAADPSTGGVNWGINDHRTKYILDVRNRVLEVQEPKLGSTTDFVTIRKSEYGEDDLAFRTWSTIDDETLSVSMDYTYTKRKELLTAKNGNGKGDTYAYVPQGLPGQVDSITNADSKITRRSYYQSTQRVEWETAAEGTADESKTKSVWTNGLLTETIVHNPSANPTPTYNASHKRYYDQANRLERLEAPNVAAERYSYTAFDEPFEWMTGDTGSVSKQVKNDEISPLGQVKLSVWSGSAGFNQRLRHDYDSALNPTSVRQVDGADVMLIEKEMTWQAWNSTPDEETFNVGSSWTRTQTHTVDRGLNTIELLDPEGANHGWPVDKNDRTGSFTFGANAVSTPVYAPGGNVIRTQTKNASGSLIAEVFYEFDSIGRRTRACTVRTSDSKVISDFVWGYDDLDRITSVELAHLACSFVYTYDGRGQIKTENGSGNANGEAGPTFPNPYGPLFTGNLSSNTVQAVAVPNPLTLVVPDTPVSSYSYDPAGNRISQTVDGVTTTFSYNAGSQLTSYVAGAVTTTCVYDDWGNLKEKHAGTVHEYFSYNHLNLLKTYEKTVDGTGTVVHWQYDYWPDGERYAKTNLLSPFNKELFVTSSGDVVTDYTATGAGVPVHANSYAQGVGTDDKVARIPATGGTAARRYYVGDAVDTMTQTLDNATGTSTEQHVRDAWGNLVVETAVSTERYAGLAQREVDGESGYTYVRNRMYDPKLGRFTQTDPIQANRPKQHYLYARNAPIMYVDPFGLDWFLSRWIREAAGAIRSAKEAIQRKAMGTGSGPVAFFATLYTDADPLSTFAEAGLHNAAETLDLFPSARTRLANVQESASNAGESPATGYVRAVGVGIVDVFPGARATSELIAGVDTNRILNADPNPSLSGLEYAQRGITVIGSAAGLLAGASDLPNVNLWGGPKSAGAPGLPWKMWNQYEKVIYNGHEYAVIGDRLYTQHAVIRMTPSGLGRAAGELSPGRSISPNLVEAVIQSGSTRTVMYKGVKRTIHSSGSVEVVTEEGGRVVVTVNPFSGGKD